MGRTDLRPGWTLKHSWQGQGKGAGNHQEGVSTWAVLAVGRASRGDGGFVQQLLETVGNMVTAQMGEGAGGFLSLGRSLGTDAWEGTRGRSGRCCR